jgi:hypothetical protein
VTIGGISAITSRPSQALLCGPPGHAFNGFSIGKGHLAEAKAAINTGLSGAKSAFQNNGNEGSAGGACGSGDTSQRDDLLAKVRAAKKI